MTTAPTGATTSIPDCVIRVVNDMLSELPPIHSDHCIYRVPDSLRRVNPECYTPRLVAIGPLHRNNSHKPMEELKLRFFNEFIARIDRNNDTVKLAHTIIEFIVREEQVIRHFYQEEIELNIEDFSRMILLDSVFIVGLLLKKKKSDPMFDKRWLFKDLVHDILLIENQIPLFVTYYVYSCLEPSKIAKRQFSFLVHGFFKDVMNELDLVLGLPFYLDRSSKPRHFIEYVWMSYVPRVAKGLDFVPALPLPIDWKPNALPASRLLEYGVKFEPSLDQCGLEFILFIRKQGVLRIPKIKVNELTETLFRNLLAFEQCEHFTPRVVSDYIIFMDSIIDTPKDVNILTRTNIIQDDLQDPEKVSELFNNLYKEAITEDRNFYFARQSHKLNKYRRNWWHQWKAKWYKWKLIFKDDYFNSPWSIISVIAAVILLGLTFVQAVCSVYQSKGMTM